MSTNRVIVTVAVMLATFLAALDVTIVGTAMPTVIGRLGGMALFPWVFSIYLLTSSVTTPIYGKLADLFGRRLVFAWGAGIFLLGSALCGLSQNMVQLIVFRGIQGLGAGAVPPVTITIIGDIFTLEQRARMQGLFSSVWGISAIIGPALGGLIVDFLDWRWVFYINLPPGVLSIILLLVFLKEDRRRGRPQLDYLGSATLTLGIGALLLALLQGGTYLPWTSPVIFGLFALSLVSLAGFFRAERRAPKPMLPLDLFHDRIITVAVVGNFLAGEVMIGASSYVPLFVQGVLSGTAVNAGAALAPMSIGWPVGSIVCGRVLLRVGDKRLAALGMLFQVTAAAMLLSLHPGTARPFVSAVSFVMGLGLGFCTTAFIVFVQAAVGWGRRGVATAAVQFMRTLGSTVGVALSGMVLNALLAGPAPAASGQAYVTTTINRLMDPLQRHLIPPEQVAPLRAALAGALHGTFWLILAFAVAGLLSILWLPACAAQERRSPARSTTTVPPDGNHPVMQQKETYR
ncbi:MAG: MDR family MFS transporter [Desulfotomaculales bacterium]